MICIYIYTSLTEIPDVSTVDPTGQDSGLRSPTARRACAKRRPTEGDEPRRTRQRGVENDQRRRGFGRVRRPGWVESVEFLLGTKN